MEDSEVKVDMSAVNGLGEERGSEDPKLETDNDKWSSWRSIGVEVVDKSDNLLDVKVEDLISDDCPNFKHFVDGTPREKWLELIGGTKKVRGKLDRSKLDMKVTGGKI